MFRSLLIIFISFFFIGCSSTSRFNSDKNKPVLKTKKSEKSTGQVRVLLDSFTHELDLSFKSHILLKSDEDNLGTLKPGESFHVSIAKDNISVQINRANYRVKELSIVPVNESNILDYNNRSYDGYFSIITINNKGCIINVVELEDYITSVVFSEMGTRFGEKENEAIKAFSICVRNYTLLKLNENKTGFDVYNDVRDQLYKGIFNSPSLLENVLKDTEGKVLKYNTEISVVFYHSSCGGSTEDCSNIFSSQFKPYLAGVKDGNSPNCRISPNFDWTENISGEEILRQLIAGKYLDSGFSYITSVEIINRFNSGRVKELVITASGQSGNEKTITLKGNLIRSVLRPGNAKGILRSLNFDIDPRYSGGILSELTVTGKGYGHGVGLCQWGAIAQAREGKNYKEILEYYFPGTYMEKINE